MSYPRVPVIKTQDWERKAAGAINEALARIEKQQAAIADDASGSANQATVNAILAALRAYGIIAP
jgi:orotate phosphoribosyltransferase-like protein